MESITKEHTCKGSLHKLNKSNLTPMVNKSSRRQLILGTRKLEDQIDPQTETLGRDKKVKKLWLFESRVNDHVKETTIKTYIHDKLGGNEDDIVVRNIETYHKKIDNKCVQIVVGQYKESVYDSNFWSSGVAFARYNFTIQDRRQHITETTAANLNFQIQATPQNQKK
ncbi:hypothetical protein WA026_004650 [Henosepilachna vigintioctopunctata]|uniref:Uncharacterized protein n=1 Tax=Henosepilachna vigintioctopunctata TaxID=420089 RepID=A0AAW1V895_9CUCU